MATAAAAAAMTAEALAMVVCCCCGCGCGWWCVLLACESDVNAPLEEGEAKGLIGSVAAVLLLLAVEVVVVAATGMGGDAAEAGAKGEGARLCPAAA